MNDKTNIQQTDSVQQNQTTENTKQSPTPMQVSPTETKALTKESIEQHIDEWLHRRNLFVKYIAKRLTPKDCQIFGDEGVIHLEGHFCRQLLQLMGLNVYPEQKPEIQYLSDGEFVVLYHITAESPNGTKFSTYGVSSSKDKFFRYRYEKGQRIEIEVSERDIPSIMKKAETNAYWRLVQLILGLKLTVDDLKALGVDISKFDRVQFKNSAEVIKPTQAQKDMIDSLRQQLEKLGLSDKEIGAYLKKNGIVGKIQTKQKASKMITVLQKLIAEKRKERRESNGKSDKHSN